MNKFEKLSAERNKHKNQLEVKHGIKGHPKTQVLYDLAWEHGHSSGFSEVENYYEDFLKLIQ